MLADTWSSFVALITKGLGNTLLVTSLSWVLAIALGVLVATLVDGRRRWVQEVYYFLSTAMRGVPDILAIYLLFYGLSSPGFRIPPLLAAVVALGVVQAAFASEAFSGSLKLVGIGQRNAARSFGLRPWQAYWHVIIPQAVTSFAPSGLNVFVALMKLSTLASAVGISEMLYIGRAEIDRSHVIEGTSIALLIVYLMATIPLTQLAAWWERRTRRGQSPVTEIRFA